MKLTYRGIKYQTPAPKKTTDNLATAIPQDNQIQDKKIPNKHPQENQLILVRPIHYYTYRGVSYTKNLFFDNNTKNLLDIDRH